MRLRVVRLSRRALLEGVDRLVELTLAVVERRELHVDGRIVRRRFFGLEQRRFSLLIAAGILVNLREHEIVGGVTRLHLDHLEEHGFSLGRIVQLVAAVRRHEILHRQLLELGILIPLRGQLVVVDSLGQKLVIGRLTPAGRSIKVVVAVAQVKVAVGEVRVGVRRVDSLNDLLVFLRGSRIVLRLIEYVRFLEGLPRLQGGYLPARGHREPGDYGKAADPHRLGSNTHYCPPSTQTANASEASGMGCQYSELKFRKSRYAFTTVNTR